MDAATALAGAIGFCVVGGLLPWMNTEAAVVAAALLLPPPLVPVLVVGAALARGRSLTVTVPTSSTVGVPPFYLVTLACGTVAVPFASFLTAALVGTAVRYALLSLATVLVRGAA